MRGAECDSGDNGGPGDWLITPVCPHQGIMTLITEWQWPDMLTQTPSLGRRVHQPLCGDNGRYATLDSSFEWLSSKFTIYMSFILTAATVLTCTGLNILRRESKRPNSCLDFTMIFVLVLILFEPYLRLWLNKFSWCSTDYHIQVSCFFVLI